jgi:hypothetical protein
LAGSKVSGFGAALPSQLPAVSGAAGSLLATLHDRRRRWSQLAWKLKEWRRGMELNHQTKALQALP